MRPDRTTPCDRDIQSAVLRALDRAFVVRPADIGVLVQQGVVTLCGMTATIADRRAAAEVAAGVVGVRAVRDELLVHVSPSPAATDLLRCAVIEALRREPGLPTAGLRFQVSADGTVVLYGTVRAESQRVLAVRLVERLRNVRAVENRLRVSSMRIAASATAAALLPIPTATSHDLAVVGA